LEYIDQDLFNKQRKVKFLDLRFCDIVFIAPDAFKSMMMIKEIRLFGNKIAADYPFDWKVFKSFNVAVLFAK
jgi:hypothetical protein